VLRLAVGMLVHRFVLGLPGLLISLLAMDDLIVGGIVGGVRACSLQQNSFLSEFDWWFLALEGFCFFLLRRWSSEEESTLELKKHLRSWQTFSLVSARSEISTNSSTVDASGLDPCSITRASLCSLGALVDRMSMMSLSGRRPE
jgi:hypothetical protein